MFQIESNITQLSETVRSLSFIPQTPNLCVGVSTMEIYNIETEQLMYRLHDTDSIKENHGNVYGILTSNNISSSKNDQDSKNNNDDSNSIFVGRHDGSIQVCDLRIKRLTHTTLKGDHSEPVKAMKFLWNGNNRNRLLSGSYDGSVCLWDLRTMNPHRSSCQSSNRSSPSVRKSKKSSSSYSSESLFSNSHNGRVNGIHITQDGSIITLSDRIRYFANESNQFQHEGTFGHFAKRDEVISGLLLSSSSEEEKDFNAQEYLITGATDSSMQVWESNSEPPSSKDQKPRLRTVSKLSGIGHQGPVTGICQYHNNNYNNDNDDEQKLVSVGGDGVIRFWSFADGYGWSTNAVVHSQSTQLRSVAVRESQNHDPCIIASGGQDHCVKLLKSSI